MTESIARSWNRYVELKNMNDRRHESYKINLADAFSMASVQRFKPSLLPEALKKKIRRSIERGYAHGRGGNAWQWTELVAAAANIRIGSIARDHMDFWLYTPSSNFIPALETLCGLTGKARLHIDVKGNWTRVYGRSRPQDSGKGPAFAEVKAFVDTEMVRYRAERMVALEALDTPKYIYITARFP